MKKIITTGLLTAALFVGINANAQTMNDKAKPASPPATVTTKTKSGATITIHYSQPSVKGRMIGKEVEPMDGKVWRTGANDATVFETDKDLKIEGQLLPAGKYGFFTLFDGKKVILIFNKTWKQWGAFKYDSTQDIIRVTTNYTMFSPASEMMTFTISDKGVVDLLWGDRKVEFKVK